jgi:polysaccharide biosynthesis/export protein
MNKFLRLFWSVLIAGSIFVGMGNNSKAAQNPADGSAQYVLGPEDEISVRVADLEEITDRTLRVDPAGDIDLPLAGRLHVTGLTVEQVRVLLAERLAKYVDAPRVTINVQDYKSEPISILGEVNNPGVHQLRGPKRLLDIISAAGGLKSDAGETVTITREMRYGTVPVPGSHADASQQFSTGSIELDGLIRGANPEANIAVCPNDVISVSRASVVYVLGEVKKAGGFSLQSSNEISLIRALSLAEGMTHEAAPRKARILRAEGAAPIGAKTDAEGTPVDVQMILAGKAPDIHLHPNDILFIPNSMAGSALKRATEAAVQIATGVIIFR